MTTEFKCFCTHLFQYNLFGWLEFISTTRLSFFLSILSLYLEHMLINNCISEDGPYYAAITSNPQSQWLRTTDLILICATYPSLVNWERCSTASVLYD